MTEQTPSVGRVVHFVYGEKHFPAIIIDPEFEVRRPEDEGGNTIAQYLYVMTSAAGNFHTTAVHDADGAVGSWHWPERV